MRKVLLFVVLVASFSLLGCKCTPRKEKMCRDVKVAKVETKVNIAGEIYVNPVEDYSAGRMLDKSVLEDVYSEVLGRIKGSGKYKVAQTKLLAKYILDIKIIELAKGSKAVPFWVGAVSSPARLIFTCSILDNSGKVLDTLNFHTANRGFARISDKEISYFKQLMVDKICEWLKIK